MYQASYAAEPSGLSVPSGYGGTALGKEDETVEVLGEVKAASEESKSESVGSFGGLWPFGLSKVFGHGGVLGDFKLGTEEILILGAALFLLLSGSKDIECLIILLVLLFVR
jgi:hypothetical protein